VTFTRNRRGNRHARHTADRPHVPDRRLGNYIGCWIVPTQPASRRIEEAADATLEAAGAILDPTQVCRSPLTCRRHVDDAALEAASAVVSGPTGVNAGGSPRTILVCHIGS